MNKGNHTDEANRDDKENKADKTVMADNKTDKAKRTVRKWLLTGAAAGLLLTGTVLALLQGRPTWTETAALLARSDPLIALLMPAGIDMEAPIQIDPNYTLTDQPSLYQPARRSEVVTLLVDVYEDGGLTLPDLEVPESAAAAVLPALVQEGTGQVTPKWGGFGFTAVAANATIEIRGEPNRNRFFHNFKIRLEDAAGQYEGQSIFNLKKAYNKPCRIEEMFAFDLFSALPDMLSLRTKFVHLYLRDTTAASPGYMDYGLYTLVEQPDENYFTNRSLDDSGSMYQAENFDFSRHPALLEVSDPGYDKAAFEQVLDIKQGDSHEHLLAMLAAVNDPAADIDQVIERFFDRRNLLSWMAMNVILGNENCVTRGYLIYKPTLSAHWYFVPSNMSGAMPAGGDDEAAGVMVSGCSMFYGNILYERFLAKPENVTALSAQVEALMTQFTAGYVTQLTSQYLPVLARYLAVNPDRGILTADPEAVLARIQGYHDNMLLNIEAFHNSLLLPRRVELEPEVYQNESVVLSWQPSRQLGGPPLTYTVEVAADPGFTQMVRTVTLTDETAVVMDELPAGQYCWRVTVTDPAGRQAGCVNITDLADGTVLYGAETLPVF